jgi:hypothetical protein
MCRCEIDNITYTLFLSERVRSRVEDVGRVELTETEAVALVRTKVVHLVCVVVAVMSAVVSAPHWGAQGTVAAALPFLAFLAANIVQAFIRGATGAEIGIHIGKSIGSFFLSLFGILLIGITFIV